MFRTEIYRILSQKRNLAVMLVGLLFILYYAMGNMVWGEGVIDDGKAYHKQEAIAKDQEIASEFTGVLTEETVRAIWEKYGPPVNYDNRSTAWEWLSAAAAQGGNDNYCNRFVTRMFGEAVTGADGQTTYVLKEGWEDSRCLDGNYVFGYTGSTSWYWDRFEMAFILAQVVVIVLLCPIFSEDYACRTADIILPSEKGRFTVWRTRMAAGALLASLYYWLSCGSIFLQYIAFYGTGGLAVSCEVAGLPMFFQQDALPLGKGLLILYLVGWFSTLVLAVFVCGFSAVNRQPFWVLIWSVLLYGGPLAFMRVVLDGLPMGRFLSVLYLMGYSMPLSYPGSFMEAPGSGKVVLTGIALTAAVTAMAGGAYRYCHHQVSR